MHSSRLWRSVRWARGSIGAGPPTVPGAEEGLPRLTRREGLTDIFGRALDSLDAK